MELAHLYSVQYKEKPNECDKEQSTKLRDQATMDPSFMEIYQSSHACKFNTHMTELEDLKSMINTLTAALCTHSEWLANNQAMKQPVYMKKKLSHQLVTKSGWSTTLFMSDSDCEMDSDSKDSEEKGDECQMIGVEE